MKKIFLYFFILISTYCAHSQINVNADCINAIPLCNTPSFTFFATSGPGNVQDFGTNSTVSNPVNNPFPPNAGCLKSGELNPQWLLITVGNAGLLEFAFGASNSPNPQVGCYDWIMWPYSPSTCADIFNNTLAPIRCNWNGSCSGGTGIASPTNIIALGGNAADFEPPIQVNACQQFIICISNYSGVNTLVSFQSIGSASLSCNPNCSPNYSTCAGSAATIVPVNYAALSNPVFSIQPGGQSNTTGSFVVTPTITTTYTTFITGTNASNAVQTLTSSSTVTVHPQPSAVPTVTQSSCTSSLTSINLGLSFFPSSPVPSYSINWSTIPNGILTPTQVAATSGMLAGPYTATVTAASGCSTTASFTIDPPPSPAQINLTPFGPNYTVTCSQPILTITVADATNNYTWTNGLIAPVTGTQIEMTFTTTGTWTITAVNPVSNCIATKTIAVFSSTTFPTAVITPSTQNITCNQTSIQTVTAIATPTVNVSHYILAPQGGTYTANSHTLIYIPGGVGEFTHCAVNEENGCKSCRTFSVTSNQGFPTFSLTSAQNFSLGCTTRSVATINITNASSTPPGGPVSYTIIGPPTSTVIPTGSLSTISTYTINTPGTWTVITKDNTSFCETRVPISILQNTFSPDISADVPRQILDCYVPRVTLRGQSTTGNVNYVWSFPGIPGTQPGDTIAVFADVAAPSKSLVANYTLTITDNSSTCKSTSVVPVYQNLYPPKAVISNGGVSAFSCKTVTITLTNQSSTAIPPATGFSTVAPVIGYFWDGPSPQVRSQLATTYVGSIPGIYTMTARDLNNGCISTATIFLADNAIYPVVNNPDTPGPFVLDCGTAFVKIYPIVSNTTTGLTYSWTAPFGTTVSAANTMTLTTNKPGIYRVLTTNTVNGCSTNAELKVGNGILSGSIAASATLGIAPMVVSFTDASTSSVNNLSITSSWSFGNGTIKVTTTPNAQHTTTYTQPGTYSVTMFSVKGNCIDTTVKIITVDIPSSIDIPNVFSPNGDGVNDLFFIKGSNLAEINMLIVDRWGNEVYKISSQSGNISWDGKNQAGKEVSDGVYLYTLQAKGLEGVKYDKNGTITVLR